MNSYNLVPFAEISAIPAQRDAQCVVDGTCGPTIDGGVYRGGQKCAGLSGYEIASLGGEPSQCAAFPLFYAANRQYSMWGDQVSTNRNPLLYNVPRL